MEHYGDAVNACMGGVKGRIGQLAYEERRNRSQIVHAAVEVSALLSPEAHFAIGRMQAIRSDLMATLASRIERDVLEAQFTATRDRLVGSLTLPADVDRALPVDADDDALLAAAATALDRSRPADTGR